MADVAKIDGFDVPTGVAVSSGSYTGNAVDDRQIPHGLGGIPTIVLITNLTTDDYWFKLHLTDNGAIYYAKLGTGGGRTAGLTAMDTTNFTVGKVNDSQTANTDGDVYHWVAIG